MCAPAHKATSPDPSRRAVSMVRFTGLRYKSNCPNWHFYPKKSETDGYLAEGHLIKFGAAAVCSCSVVFYMVGWLAASMIFTNFSGIREAPPIRPPSMSG